VQPGRVGIARKLLQGFEVPEQLLQGRWLLVDDICDGGGTFNGILNELNAMEVPGGGYYPATPNDSLDLYVSHAVFSGNAFENLRCFGTVYTTNTYEPTRTLPDNYVRIDVISTLLKRIK
jgi:ribose-phosphate pyrophosphokinase